MSEISSIENPFAAAPTFEHGEVSGNLRLGKFEAMYEELFAGNDAIPSKHPRIMTTTEYVIDPDTLAQQVAYLMVACATNDTAMIRLLVKKLVRGYTPTVAPEAEPAAAALSGTGFETPEIASHMPLRVITPMHVRH